ncbi:MAG: anti-sigma factor [Gemmatimonadaceae bacterium]
MQHLDEGTIHAWLDGALTAEEAARVERHAAECAECASVVAEARGLVAGASRILSALDDVPAVVPAGARGRWAEGGGVEGRAVRGAAAPPARAPSPARRPFWSRPAALAAAATVVLIGGTAVVWDRAGGPRTAEMLADSSAVFGHRVSEGQAGATASASGAAPTSEVTQRGTTAAPPTFVDVGAERGVARARDGAAAGTASTTRPLSGSSVPASLPASRDLLGAGVRDTAQRLEVRPANAAGQAAGAPVAQRGVMQKGVITTEKATPLAPPAPAPAVAAADQAPQKSAATKSLEMSNVTVTSTASADTSTARRRAAARQATARRAAAPTRDEVPMVSREVPGERVTRGDTVYRAGRTDTITVAQVETLVVDTPRPPSYRPEGRTAAATRAFPVSGCYEVLEGGLPRFITLTVDPVWSGAAEHAFVATAHKAIGYWSQPKSGAIHLVIDRAVVTARIDTSTRELRGTAQRGRKKVTFVARRGCR